MWNAMNSHNIGVFFGTFKTQELFKREREREIGEGWIVFDQSHESGILTVFLQTGCFISNWVLRLIQNKSERENDCLESKFA